MAEYRLTHAAQNDIVAILAWSDEQFGEHARKRYEALIVAAIRDAASSNDDLGRRVRPELGIGVFSWHLVQSRANSSKKPVRNPRRVLLCRDGDEVLIIGRVLHDTMELKRHSNAQESWD